MNIKNKRERGRGREGEIGREIKEREREKLNLQADPCLLASWALTRSLQIPAHDLFPPVNCSTPLYMFTTHSDPLLPRFSRK